MILTLLSIFLYADFFKSEEKAAVKYENERAHYCKVFTDKVLEYKKNIRNDELAKITLESYINRSNIYCSKEEPKKAKIVKKIMLEKPKYIKDISREDERLCKVFQHKLENYKKGMRKDALAVTTLDSYKKRTQIFCSKETLEQKEKDVLNENQKLCNVFEQGPILCKKFDKNFNIIENDSLSKETLNSFQKRAKVFCSSKPLNKKDLEVYQEHKRLCSLFNDKIIAYQKDMRNDSLAHATLKSYKKRASYFCATSNTLKNK
jgi:hypothetical protein